MIFSKESREYKICRDQKYRGARKAFQWSFNTLFNRSYHPSWQDIETNVKNYPKYILSNSFLFKLYHLENRKYYYYHDGLQLEYLSGKFKEMATKKGKNKGKSSKYINSNQNYQKWYTKKTCSEDDISLVYNFKKNYPKKPDDSMPKCQICFYNNSGFGKKYFKECQHGSLMCSCCAKI